MSGVSDAWYNKNEFCSQYDSMKKEIQGNGNQYGGTGKIELGGLTLDITMSKVSGKSKKMYALRPSGEIFRKEGQKSLLYHGGSDLATLATGTFKSRSDLFKNQKKIFNQIAEKFSDSYNEMRTAVWTDHSEDRHRIQPRLEADINNIKQVINSLPPEQGHDAIESLEYTKEQYEILDALNRGLNPESYTESNIDNSTDINKDA